MKRIVSFLLLFITFFNKIISTDTSKEPKTITVKIEDYFFKIDAKIFANGQKISEITQFINTEIKNTANLDNFYKDNCINDKQKEELKKFIDNLDITKYSLENFKKNDENFYYFLGFYKNPVSSYNDITITWTDIKEIHFKKNSNSPKNYDVVFEDNDIYDESKVGIKNELKSTIYSIPFDLNKLQHLNTLKTIIKDSLKSTDFKINENISINDNKINIKVEKKDEQTDDDFNSNCLKKFKFHLKLDVGGAVDTKDSQEFYYKDYKDKITNKSLTVNDLNKIFDLKNTYLFEKKIEANKLDENNYNIELKYLKKITISNIDYVFTKEDKSNAIDEKLKNSSGGAIVPITIYTDCKETYDFLYKLSSLLHYNLYEHYDLKTDTDGDVNPDFTDLAKIEINQNKLPVEYVVKFNEKDCKLKFAKEGNFSTICRLLVDENDLKNYKLTGDGKDYISKNSEIITSVKDGNPIIYKLELQEKEVEKDKKFENNVKRVKIELKKGAVDGEYKTLEQVWEESRGVLDKNNKIRKQQENSEKKNKSCSGN